MPPSYGPPYATFPASGLTAPFATHLYATDEDIALRVFQDYGTLVPMDQKLLTCTDGAFLAGQPWDVVSPSFNFIQVGLKTGNVARMTQPASFFKPLGEAYVICDVQPNVLSLRRKGLPSGVGQPPAPLDGLTGVAFDVTTFEPQIRAACYDLNKRFGIDDLITGRRSCDLFDPDEVRDATVLTVLYRQYLALARGGDPQSDRFATKAQAYKQELDNLLARTVIHWVDNTGANPVTSNTTRFDTRLSR